jgi:SAM-dependent methyltransferase
MKGFNTNQFHDYMEIYDRRYVKTIRKIAKLPLDGKVISVCNAPQVGFANRIEAGAILSSYPYKQFVPLNDADCTDPFLYPEKTCQPIPDEISDNSVDLIGCFGGLHHIPSDRVNGFVKSLHSKLRPGGVILLREHNASNDNVKSIAAVVHSFVNAADGISWEVEKKRSTRI